MKTLRLWLVVVLAGLAFAAHAQTDRERIASQRAAATAKFAERQRECQAQFVVTACVEAAQREEHAVLTRLRREEQALNDAQRRDKAARRRSALAEHADAQAARGADAASAVPREAARRPLLPAAPAASKAGDSSRERVLPSAAEQHVDEQRNQASFEARQRAAQTHREAVEKRNAQRAAAGKVAAPLPVPGAKGASAP